MPKVSIILPVYNGEKYISQAIDSIMAQTFKDWELIVVDDGSTDATNPQIPHFNDKVHNIRFGKNEGIVAALNAGLISATGEYIARHDADDYSDPRRFQMQVDFLDAFPHYGVHGSAILLMDSQDFPKYVLRYPVKPSMADLMESCCVGHPTVMFRREVYEKIGGYDPEFNMGCCEDYDYWLRVREHFKIFNSTLPLYTKREHDGSSIGQLIRKDRRDVINTFDDLARVKARIRGLG